MENSRGGLVPSSDAFAVILQRLVDALWIVVSLYVACRFYPQEWSALDTAAAAFAVIVFHLIAEVNGLYRPWRGSPMRYEIFQVLTTWVLVVPMLLFIGFATKTSSQYSRVISISWFVIAPNLLVVSRVAMRLILQELRRKGRNSRNVAIAGATHLAQKLADRIAGDPSTGMRIAGFYDDRTPGRRIEPKPEHGEVIGSLSKMVEDAREGKLDLVYITLPLKAEPRINTIIRKLADTTASVYVVADFFVFDLAHARWSSIGDLPIVSIFDTPFYGVGGWLKRLEDMVLGTAILAMISIPMLIIAIVTRLTSPGRVFFVQRRYGLNGKEIRVFKFRTMSVCEDGPSVQQATKNDSRITRFGAFLRQTSLDELPQFFNVIKGDMSIVGPRPHAVAHNELYRSKIHGYMLRHKVKPGITGWAQVNGWRGETDTVEKMEKRVEHDLEYIHKWSLLWDLQIIFMTVFGSKTRKNAF